MGLGLIMLIAILLGAGTCFGFCLGVTMKAWYDSLNKENSIEALNDHNEE